MPTKTYTTTDADPQMMRVDTKMLDPGSVPQIPGKYNQPDTAVPTLYKGYYASGIRGEPSIGNGPVGRTGWHQMRFRLHHAGYGDAGCLNTNVFVSNGAAEGGHGAPAGICLNGQVTAGADNIYANVIELVVKDNGYDILSNGMVQNFYRTKEKDPSNYWDGIRLQSQGSIPCDSAFLPVGRWKWGYDSSAARGACDMALKPGDRIYLDTQAKTAPGTGIGMYAKATTETYITYTEGAGIQMIVDGLNAFAVDAKGIKIGGRRVDIRKQSAINNATAQIESLTVTVNNMLEAMRAAGVIHR